MQWLQPVRFVARYEAPRHEIGTGSLLLLAQDDHVLIPTTEMSAGSCLTLLDFSVSAILISDGERVNI
jgi:hypothetical protein